VILRRAGLSVALPPGWDVRIKRHAGAGSADGGNAVLHAATLPLPAERGDFGSGAVELLGPDDAFVALFEYDPGSAGSALFATSGMPEPAAGDFSPTAMQRPGRGRSGAQYFFTVRDRAFCLHVVVGSHGRRAAATGRVRDLLRGLAIGQRV
jgi:hypothetical protein